MQIWKLKDQYLWYLMVLFHDCFFWKWATWTCPKHLFCFFEQKQNMTRGFQKLQGCVIYSIHSVGYNYSDFYFGVNHQKKSDGPNAVILFCTTNWLPVRQAYIYIYIYIYDTLMIHMKPLPMGCDTIQCDPISIWFNTMRFDVIRCNGENMITFNTSRRVS